MAEINHVINEIANNQLKPTIVDTVEGTYEGREVMCKFTVLDYPKVQN